MGIAFRVVQQHKVADGIEATRRLFSRFWFDEKRCRHGIECISQYRYEYDEKKGVFRDNPLHDWASHCADSLRQLAMGWQEVLTQKERSHAPVMAKSDFEVF